MHRLSTHSLSLSPLLSEFPRQFLCWEFHWDADRHQCRQNEGDAQQLLWVSIWRSYFCKPADTRLTFTFLPHLLPVKYPRYQKVGLLLKVYRTHYTHSNMHFLKASLLDVIICVSHFLSARSDFEVKVFVLNYLELSDLFLSQFTNNITVRDIKQAFSYCCLLDIIQKNMHTFFCIFGWYFYVFNW